MTTVLARKFKGGSITILCDTMISMGGGGRDDRIPGQLKAVVVRSDVSIAFAGRFAPAIDAIRFAAAELERGAGLDEIYRHLSHASCDDSCEFIVASHRGAAELRKIHSGRLAGDQPFHWLGDPSPLRAIEALKAKRGSTIFLGDGLPDGCDPEAHDFSGDFISLFAARPSFNSTVGGLPIVLHAYPEGHEYGNYAASYAPGPITVGGPPHPEALAPGGDVYSCNILGFAPPGIGMLAAYLPEARAGYIYAPLQQDEVAVLRSVSMQEVVDALKRQSGG